MKSLIVATVVAISSHVFAADCSKDSNYPIVSKAELQKIVEKKTAVILDVNPSESYQKSHVPGAIHFESIEKNFASSLPADKSAEIVAYCGSKMCTAWKKAAEMACQLGYTNIKHFKEGIAGWNKKS